MIPYQSHLAWNIGPITIQSYGLLVAVAFLVATYFAVKEAKRHRVDSDHIYNIMICLIIGGIVGARILHILINWQEFLANPISILYFWQGGLAWMGGFLGGIGALYIYTKWQNLYFWKITDVLVPAIPIGHAIGRLGCILGDGGHLGKLTSMSWGVLYNGEVRHLTAAYDLIAELAIFSIIWFGFRHKKLRHGHLLSIYVMMYSFQRFFTDFFRIDPLVLGLTPTQWISLALFFGFGAYLFNKVGSMKSVLCIN